MVYQVPGPHRRFTIGISIPADRVGDIKRFPRPKTSKELERLLGICAFFHRFGPQTSGKMASLTRLKNISRQKEFDEAWLPEHDQAFADVKAGIASTTQLVHPHSPRRTDRDLVRYIQHCCWTVLVQLQHGIFGNR